MPRSLDTRLASRKTRCVFFLEGLGSDPKGRTWSYSCTAILKEGRKSLRWENAFWLDEFIGQLLQNLLELLIFQHWALL